MRLRILGIAVLLASQAGAQTGLPARAVAILRAECGQCHASTVKMSGLDLSTRAAALAGGGRGPALTPGKPDESPLLQAVRRTGKIAMPPAKPLDAASVETLREWIASGAEWPASGAAAAQPQWWSYRNPTRPAGASIDSFIDAKLRAEGIRAAPEASRAVLARRLYFDLHGLPPTAPQLREFVEDKDPRAWAKLVDRLLESPRYGEKWARHWLDLARYSDTAGFELDSYIPDAWRYRDWVIASFNGDKPYDRFIREQIAGDEFFPEDPASVTGTGFYCVGPNRDLYPDQSDINREETLTDFVDTTAAAFLGVTMNCARCHDHKFDPFTQRDYYKLRAVFAPAVKTPIALDRLSSLGHLVAENVREIRLREIGERIASAQSRCRDKLREQKARVDDKSLRSCMNDDETARLREMERELVTMYQGYVAKPFACGLNDVGDHGPETLVPVKGQARGVAVKAGVPAVFGGAEFTDRLGPREATGPIPLGPTTWRRRALADWIASKDNPLTARVMVNRIWQHHFGRGLVATPSDFGTRGRAPSHPELLDWLAVEFVERGWSVKHIHRLILNSAAYQRSAEAVGNARERDPDNALLARFTRRRLTPEELRDAVLMAAGELNLKMGGRPVVPPLSKDESFGMIGRNGMWIETGDVREHARRSIYLIQKRTFRLPMMEVFDSPESMLTCARRDSSTTATQSLTLLNGGFLMARARALAERAAKPDDAVGEIWRAALSRDPSPAEAARAARFLERQTENAGSREAALIELARGVFNVNEFLYVD